MIHMMTSEPATRPLDHYDASGIDLRLRHSVRVGIWKRLLWRTVPAALVFLIVSPAVLEAAKRFLPTGNPLESPATLLLFTVTILCLLIAFSAKHVLALAVNLEMSHLELLGVLSQAIAKRDDATEEHNLRVAIMAVHLAVAVGLDPRLIRGLFIGALLHDIGKLGVPDGILLKPGKLSPEERREMERHVVYGDEILRNSTFLHGAARVVHCHHERFDGGGYPEGRKGFDIPPEARLFAIVDTFDALTSERPYKKPMGLKEALSIMEREHGAHFDPTFLDAFKKIAGVLYTKVVSAGPENLRELVLELIEKYYTFVDPRRLKL